MQAFLKRSFRASRAMPVLVLALTVSFSWGVRAVDEPVVGVLSQPVNGAGAATQTYIAASYVKFLEAAGARVVPIRCDEPENSMLSLLDDLNGVLLPGGSQDLTPGHCYYDAASSILRYSHRRFKQEGEHFPVHGTCLGLEVISVALSEDYDILDEFDAINFPSKVTLTAEAASSRMFRGFTPKLMDELQHSDITFENHFHGLLVSTFESNALLAEYFTLLGTSEDRKGAKYVAAFEGKDWPISAVQFHPEKNAYEWQEWQAIPHSQASIHLMQSIADAFVAAVRKSTNTPGDEAALDARLIYNFQPVHSDDEANGRGDAIETSFEQVYYFDRCASDASVEWTWEGAVDRVAKRFASSMSWRSRGMLAA